MAIQILDTARANDIIVKLIGRDDPFSFSVLYEGGNLVGLAYSTSDYANARIMFKRSVALAAKGFTHPAWRKSA
jgi:hypothetical protein